MPPQNPVAQAGAVLAQVRMPAPATDLSTAHGRLPQRIRACEHFHKIHSVPPQGTHLLTGPVRAGRPSGPSPGNLLRGVEQVFPHRARNPAIGAGNPLPARRVGDGPAAALTRNRLSKLTSLS